MAFNTSDAIIDTLVHWGVDTVFGIPGDGINGLIEALRKRRDDIRFVQTRHEESAAFMACGYAKYTGKLGVCIATSGPGGIPLLGKACVPDDSPFTTGGVGLLGTDPALAGSTIERALNHPGPVIVDCIVDPHEPPMPPKVKAAQALKFAEALASGTPAAGKIGLTVAANAIRELI